MLTGRHLAMLTAAIIVELSVGSDSPATPDQRDLIGATASSESNDLTAIARLCEMTAVIARRMAPKEPLESGRQTTQ